MDYPLNAEYTKLAGVLNWQKKYKEAIVALQKVIKEDPKDEAAQFCLAKNKDAYYADLDSKIKAYQVFVEKFSQGA